MWFRDRAARAPRELRHVVVAAFLFALFAAAPASATQPADDTASESLASVLEGDAAVIAAHFDQFEEIDTIFVPLNFSNPFVETFEAGRSEALVLLARELDLSRDQARRLLTAIVFQAWLKQLAYIDIEREGLQGEIEETDWSRQRQARLVELEAALELPVEVTWQRVETILLDLAGESPDHLGLRDAVQRFYAFHSDLDPSLRAGAGAWLASEIETGRFTEAWEWMQSSTASQPEGFDLVLAAAPVKPGLLEAFAKRRYDGLVQAAVALALVQDLDPMAPDDVQIPRARTALVGLFEGGAPEAMMEVWSTLPPDWAAAVWTEALSDPGALDLDLAAAHVLTGRDDEAHRLLAEIESVDVRDERLDMPRQYGLRILREILAPGSRPAYDQVRDLLGISLRSDHGALTARSWTLAKAHWAEAVGLPGIEQVFATGATESLRGVDTADVLAMRSMPAEVLERLERFDAERLRHLARQQQRAESLEPQEIPTPPLDPNDPMTPIWSQIYSGNDPLRPPVIGLWIRDESGQRAIVTWKYWDGGSSLVEFADGQGGWFEAAGTHFTGCLVTDIESLRQTEADEGAHSEGEAPDRSKS